MAARGWFFYLISCILFLFYNAWLVLTHMERKKKQETDLCHGIKNFSEKVTVNIRRAVCICKHHLEKLGYRERKDSRLRHARPQGNHILSLLFSTKTVKLFNLWKYYICNKNFFNNAMYLSLSKCCAFHVKSCHSPYFFFLFISPLFMYFLSFLYFIFSYFIRNKTVYYLNGFSCER